jgi:hypothetical protein
VQSIKGTLSSMVQFWHLLIFSVNVILLAQGAVLISIFDSTVSV